MAHLGDPGAHRLLQGELSDTPMLSEDGIHPFSTAPAFHRFDKDGNRIL